MKKKYLVIGGIILISHLAYTTYKKKRMRAKIKKLIEKKGEN